MPAGYTRPQPTENHLLAALSAQERAHLLPMMQTVQLTRNQMIHLSGDTIEAVYFPIPAALALVSILEDGSSTGIGTVGWRGMVGLPVLLGGGSTPFNVVVQVPGTARWMRTSAFDDEIGLDGPLDRLLLRYAQAFMSQVTQWMACDRHHAVKPRMATWLLTIRDSLTDDHLPVTHEFLARMLGVGRPSASLAAGALQEAGLIHYRRGSVSIIDVQGLESVACECYQIVRDGYDHLLVHEAHALPVPMPPKRRPGTDGMALDDAGVESAGARARQRRAQAGVTPSIRAPS